MTIFCICFFFVFHFIKETLGLVIILLVHCYLIKYLQLLHYYKYRFLCALYLNRMLKLKLVKYLATLQRSGENGRTFSFNFHLNSTLI